MSGYRKILMTLAIGTVMVFPAFAVPASAGEGRGSGSASGTGLQAKSDGEQGGTEYTYRNTWNHRNKKQNRYGNMGEDARYYAQGHGFVDEDGDGINDLAPDHDGDGIPNGQDSDWVKNKRDGTGYKQGKQMTEGGKRCERSQFRGSKRAQAAR